MCIVCAANGTTRHFNFTLMAPTKEKTKASGAKAKKNNSSEKGAPEEKTPEQVRLTQFYTDLQYQYKYLCKRYATEHISPISSYFSQSIQTGAPLRIVVFYSFS